MNPLAVAATHHGVRFNAHPGTSHAVEHPERDLPAGAPGQPRPQQIARDTFYTTSRNRTRRPLRAMLTSLPAQHQRQEDRSKGNLAA